MKISLARAGGMLTLLGGLVSLAGFIFLPFAQDPVRFFPVNGIQLLQAYAKAVSLYGPLPGRQASEPMYTLWIISNVSLWAVLIIFALITLLALFVAFRRKPGIVLPIICLVLSLFAITGLFLAFFYLSPDGLDILPKMFAGLSDDFPTIVVGWWVSLSGLIVTLIASVLTIIGHFQPMRPSSTGLSTPYGAGSSPGFSSRPYQPNSR
jgi:hypothetical protein